MWHPQFHGRQNPMSALMASAPVLLALLAQTGFGAAADGPPKMPGRPDPANSIRLLVGVETGETVPRPIAGAQVTCGWMNRRVRLRTDKRGNAAVIVTLSQSVPKQLVTVQCTVTHPRYVRSAFTRNMDKVVSPHPVRVRLQRR